MARYKVGYIVGSLATASINRTLAKALIRLAPPELEFVEVPIKDSRCTATTTTPTTPPKAGRSRTPSRPSTPCCL
jgi:NAD(P)H-dependent FMN reductase